MAQHDFTIDNQSAPAFRGDLNNALEALGTLSSGATAPATTYANMLWYDTANNILKMRSEADDAWINLGTLDQSGNTFTPAGIANLTQTQAEDDTSTVFGQVSGQRLAQASAKHSFSVTEFTYDFDVSGAVGTVEFTSDLSGFDYLEIESTLSFNSDTSPDLQFSPDGGSTYRTSGYIGGVQDGVDVSSISGGIRLIRTNSNDCLGFCRIIGLGNASVKTTASGVFGGGGGRVTATGGRYNTAEAHNALRVNFNGSLTTQGVLKLRGYKRP